jgi:hypothetical protein
MNEGTQKLVAELLARRLGVSGSELEPALADPLAAVVALSIMGQAEPATDPRVDPADPARCLERIAAMVGACPLCVGENQACIECWGEGGPGSSTPQRAALLRWIGPALRRLRLGVTRLDETGPDQKRGDYP